MALRFKNAISSLLLFDSSESSFFERVPLGADILMLPSWSDSVTFFLASFEIVEYISKMNFPIVVPPVCDMPYI